MAGDQQQLLVDAYGSRKRELEDDYEDDEDASSYSGGRRHTSSSTTSNIAAAKRARRHHWQQKYETEFGLIAIEKDHATGDVVLAMCGFCKAFGREGKYEQLLAADESAAAAPADGKKRRRRSLTTTKFFRAFRVDNIRSHLQGAHPRRWAQFEMLPKQEALRARFLQQQQQGDLPYDSLPMVDDVVLHGASLSAADADLGYAQSQSQMLAGAPQMHHASPPSSATGATTTPTPPVTMLPETVVSTSTTGLNGSNASSSTQQPPVMQAFLTSSRDYEKHMAEQLALDRERFEFEKAKFKKKVELRERELALREKHMAQDRVLHDERMAQDRALHEKLLHESQEAALRESAKFLRLAEVVRDAVASAASGGAAGASSPSLV